MKSGNKVRCVISAASFGYLIFNRVYTVVAVNHDMIKIDDPDSSDYWWKAEWFSLATSTFTLGIAED